MQLETQFKFSRNPQLKYFIRENSYWYKYLNRDSNRFDEFVEEMKITYKLTTTDKINNTLDRINTITMFINALK